MTEPNAVPTDHRNRWLTGAILGAVLFFAAACTTTDIVYRDRQPFNAAPDQASGLLGYYTVSTKQTTCGNCHVGHQADWKQTLHAEANATLAGNAHASASCYSCHDTDNKGNSLAGPAGWDVVNDSAYQDVQCESCHGPGTEHVKLPDDKSKWPLARLTLYDSAASCAACHTGTRHGFVQGWEQSGHAQLASPAVNNTTSTCRNCHEGKTALKSWGVVTNYQELDSSSVNSPTTCAVCHNPHGSANDHQLRFPINTPDPDQNLCMKCHLNRGAPTASSGSPHGAAGYVLLGVAGYRPSGVAIDTQVVLTTHSSSANPKLCAGCHVNAFDAVDAQSGGFVFHSTGHDFRPLPCVDGNGAPTFETDCAYNTTARSYATCAKSGCHANVAVAASLLSVLSNDIKTMADQIWTDGNGNNKVDAPPTDGGYLATIQRDNPTELSTTTVLTPARGAQFNVLLFADRNYGHADGSFGVHNPFLARALLAANINELRSAYGLSAPSASVQAEVTKALSDAKARSPNFIRTPQQ